MCVCACVAVWLVLGCAGVRRGGGEAGRQAGRHVPGAWQLRRPLHSQSELPIARIHASYAHRTLQRCEHCLLNIVSTTGVVLSRQNTSSEQPIWPPLISWLPPQWERGARLMEQPLPQCWSTNDVPRVFFPRVAIGCRLSLKIERNLPPSWAGGLSVSTWYDTTWIGGTVSG